MTLDDIRALCAAPSAGDADAEAAVAGRQTTLTKPPGSLGRLEEFVGWLARWQRRDVPRLDRVEVLVFAGNHGVVARGVSPYPAAVTAQMVGNFAAGGAAINQIARVAGATLKVIPLDLDHPTGDIVATDAMEEAAFVVAVAAGHDAVVPGTDLLALGEMGIGNTTVAAAMAAALFGGGGARWCGRGTGVDDAGLSRKIAAVDAAVARVGQAEPLDIARRLGGRELAAILGAVLAARRHGVPVLLDGFVCTAAAASLAVLADGGLDHCRIAHRSDEAGHAALAEALGMTPLLDLRMRLGEASGAALAIPVLRAAVACHTGMATFGRPVSRIVRVAQDAAVAMMLLTRLPVLAAPVEVIPLARTVWAFPLIGGAVGVIGAVAAFVATWLHLTPWVVASVVLAAQLLATGALHEDGLADTVDGIGGGRTRARKLEIMRDSRIGSYGTIALFIALMARAGAIAAIVTVGPNSVGGYLIAAGSLGRGAMLLPIATLEPARGEGLASGLATRTRPALLVGGGLTLFFGQFMPGYAGLCGTAGAIGAGLFMASRMNRYLGGYTGDTLGATCVLAECCALAGMAAALTS